MTVKGFSLIELIFTLLLIGVIMSFAISTVGNSINKTALIKLKSDILLIKNGITQTLEKQLFVNQTKALDELENNNTHLFSNILKTPIINSTEKYSWNKIDVNTYLFNLGDESLEFKYDNELFIFSCDTSNDICKEVLQ